MRKYIACQFGEKGRTYTYHYDGEEQLAVGDRVKTESGVFVKVVGFHDNAPDFETREIIEKVDQP